MVPELGTILGDKYRILRVLGQGGMGVVYEAENVLTLKRAAIKRLHAQLLAHEDAYHRVLHEARASARIRHRNVVDVYDVLRDDDSICLVMELLIGEPLSALIARGGLTLSRFISLLLPAMRGLEAAHAAGVIHRDIKPENIFLQSEPGQNEPVPKVIDFGISKVIDPDAGPHLTRSGVTMGTPKYVSYEQLAGAKDVDQRADVYAIGVMLYEAITGQPPYEATNFGQQAIRFATTVPRRVRELRPEIPEAFDALVMKAIARDREERISSMRELLDALAPYADANGPFAELAAFPERNAIATIVGVGPALTTTPMQTTPAPAASPKVTLEAPARDVSTSQVVERPRPPTKTLLWLVALLVGAGLFVLFARRPSAAPDGARASLTSSEQATSPEPSVSHQANESDVSRDSHFESSREADSLASGELGASGLTTQPEPADERPLASQEQARPSKGPRKNAASRGPGHAAPRVPLRVEPEPFGPDDSVHRAGRVTPDQF